MRILLHTCCAPCSIKCVESLVGDGIKPVLFWYNPNIHPFTEYRSRKETLVQYTGEQNLELIECGVYGLREFIAGICPAFDNRCDYCYSVRMEATAKYAAENGYNGFSTTLLISPYQDHERLRSTAELMAEKHGIDFLYRDFRPLFRDGQKTAREMGLYMQKYCGCIFSEEERYAKVR